MITRRLADLCLAGMLGAAAPPPAAPLQLHPERTSKNMLGATTRGGQIVVREDAAGWRVVLGNRIVLDGRPLGAVRLRLVTVAAGRDADLVVVLLNTSTSTSCPVRFAVVAVDRSGHAVASPPFDNCADLLTLAVDGNALVFTMPANPGANGTKAVASFRYVDGRVAGPLAP